MLPSSSQLIPWKGNAHIYPSKQTLSIPTLLRVSSPMTTMAAVRLIFLK